MAASQGNGTSDVCRAASEDTTLWLVMTTTLPILINFGTMFILAFTIYKVKQVKQLSDTLTSSTHWLSRTAVRIGIGPSAKKALVEYAKGKPEFAKLMTSQS
uniref:Transmembrane protein n=1 Tax=Haemonchus contortus TaxID=6289 RepID=A0A7I4YD67_HAECO|nr:Hypothetical protein CBG00488 [Haemonchus contortus]